MGFLRISLVVFLVAVAPSISSAADTNTVSSTVVTDKSVLPAEAERDNI